MLSQLLKNASVVYAFEATIQYLPIYKCSMPLKDERVSFLD